MLVILFLGTESKEVILYTPLGTSRCTGVNTNFLKDGLQDISETFPVKLHRSNHIILQQIVSEVNKY